MDHSPPTKNGNKYVVTLVDYFSKWPEAAPLPDKSAFGVGMFLYELFCRYAYTVVYICRHAHISISTSTDLDAVRLSFQIRVVNL